jgi:hypothetical protein
MGQWGLPSYFLIPPMLSLPSDLLLPRFFSHFRPDLFLTSKPIYFRDVQVILRAFKAFLHSTTITFDRLKAPWSTSRWSRLVSVCVASIAGLSLSGPHLSSPPYFRGILRWSIPTSHLLKWFLGPVPKRFYYRFRHVAGMFLLFSTVPYYEFFFSAPERIRGTSSPKMKE